MQMDHLPPSVEERLKARARRTGRSFATVAREAVLDGIDALEHHILAVAQKRRQQARQQARQSDPPPSTMH